MLFQIRDELPNLARHINNSIQKNNFKSNANPPPGGPTFGRSALDVERWTLGLSSLLRVFFYGIRPLFRNKVRFAEAPASSCRSSPPAREWSRRAARDMDGQTERSNEREHMSQRDANEFQIARVDGNAARVAGARSPRRPSDQGKAVDG